MPRAASLASAAPRTRSPRRRTRSTQPASSAVPKREAVLYARVSSKDQEKGGFSIPAQQRLLRAYAEDQGYSVVEEFTDVETAKRAGRTSFGRMLAWLERHSSCRVILVEKTDRLYRNLKDWVALDELPELEIHLVKEGTVLSDGSRSSEKFIHGIKVLMAKNYIDNLSEETRKGMIEKALQGIWPSRAPLGYRNVQREDGKRIIEQDPTVAPLVTELFEWYATGQYSLKALTKKAKDAGMVFRKSRKPIPRTTIHKILTNPLYIGEFDWDGVRYQGIHEPLVSHELFERVGEVMSGRSTNCRREQKREFSLSGLVLCSQCWDEGGQRQLIGSLIKKKYTYYHCSGCREQGRAKYYKEAMLEAALLGQLQTLRLDREVMAWVAKALRSSHADMVAHREASMARLQAEWERMQARIDTAYEDRLDGRIAPDFFERKAAEWRDEQAQLRRRMDLHLDADQASIDQGIALMELAGRAVELYEQQNPREKRRLLEFLMLNSFWDGESLEVDWRKPFDILAESPAGPPTRNAPGGGSEGVFEKWLPKKNPA